MSTYQCSSCGRTVEPAPTCPICGAEQGAWADELLRIEKSIAEMKARDAALSSEQRQIAQKMQAALFQRDILTHANEERLKATNRPRRFSRGPKRRTQAAGAAPAAPRVPRQETGSGPGRGPAAGSAVDDAGRRPPTDRPSPPEAAEHRPAEASSREVQNILLGLGALLLGVAAAVFALFAISSFDDLTRVLILLVATAGMLVGAPVVAARGLTSTAETVAAVGLLLVPLVGFAVWSGGGSWQDGLPPTVFAGLTLLVSALVAVGHAGVTGLAAPRYAAVLAGQPVLPLLGYDRIHGATGWAFALALVAALDLGLTWLFSRGAVRLPTRWPDRRPESYRDRGPAGTPVRPETAAEEVDLVLSVDEEPEPVTRRGFLRGGPTGDRPDDGHRGDPVDAPDRTAPFDVDGGPTGTVRPSAATRLSGLTSLLVGLVGAAALVFAVVALVGAATVPDAVRAAAALLAAATVAMAAALLVGHSGARNLAAGVLAVAVIGSVARIAAIALPGRALLLVAVVILGTAVAVRAVPESSRRGPQLAAGLALAAVGILVAADAVRAAAAPVRAALPVWAADLTTWPGEVADAAPAGWQLAVTAFLLTVAAALALPDAVRREATVLGAVVTALAVPASFGLSWSATPWPWALAAVAIGLAGLTAGTERAAGTHAGAAGAVGLAAAGAALTRPGLTAAVLFTLAVGGVLVAAAPRLLTSGSTAAQGVRLGSSAGVVADWAAGGAAFALPGAVAAFAAATVALGPAPSPAELERASLPVLAAGFLAVCLTLGYAAVAQVAWRRISFPLALGTGLGALGVTAAAFGAPGATLADALVGALLLVAATLVFLAPSIDAGRRADRMLDGADLAAAAAAVALVGTLARISAILVDGAGLAVAAGLILIVATGVRAMPGDWRRGPVLGVAVSGAVIAVLAGATALSGGVRVLATPGRIWAADLDGWPVGSGGGSAWQAPVALVMLAGAAAILLPRPWKYDIAGALVGLATIGTPAALGLPWWSPMIVGGVVATVYGVSAIAAADPRAALARTAVAAGVALHAVGASLVRPWTTAAALGVVVLVGAVVAALARTVATLPDERLGEVPVEPGTGSPADRGVHVVGTTDPALMPEHLVRIGGAATGAAVFALPGALAALAAATGRPAGVVLAAALAGSGLAVVVTALARREVPRYLPYASAGIIAGGTVTAVASLPTELPSGVYAAAAALLGVLAELIRSTAPPPGEPAGPASGRSTPFGGLLRERASDAPQWRWSVSPQVGAMIAAVLPTLVALVTIAPALVATLVEPYRVLAGIWDGPPPELLSPSPDVVDGTNLLTALLLTATAALAATGFNRRRPARAVPVVLPGIAVTVLIAPVSLGEGWPAGTMAALTVFTIAMLGLALTPAPPVSERARSLRLARLLIFGIGLAAGGAGLAGSLATRSLTLFTLGSAVGVGVVAALFGRIQIARILGWIFAAVMAQLFVLTTGLVVGIAPVWSAFGVLAVGGLLLVVSATLPRLRQPEALREAATVEWSGYAAALIAAALAFDSPRHIAALLAAWGAVVGVAATRPGRRPAERRALHWAAVACEIAAWWLLMRLADVALPEAYTLPFALLALVVGLVEARQRPDLSSWLAYGPALVAAFLPTLVIVLVTDGGTVRQVLLLLGAVGTLILGSRWRQQAPVVVGAAVTAVTALHALTAYGPWLVLIPVGVVLLVLGASNERRRRTQDRLRGALRGLR